MPTRLCLLLLLWLAGTGEVAAQYTLSTEKPHVGEPVTVTLPAPADTLLVTYRPNSSIARPVPIPTEGRQTVTWTPAEAGVVALSTPEGGGQNVSVRFDAPPVSGILVLLLAGAILFGGAVFAFVKLFQGAPPESDPPVRPDT